MAYTSIVMYLISQKLSFFVAFLIHYECNLMKYLIIMQPLPKCSLLSALAILLIIVLPVCTIRPTQPIIANPNTQSSSANFFFYFELEYDLPSDGYLMITFTPYITAADPVNCDMLSHIANPITTCVNLNTAGGDVTINQPDLNSVNPNINATETVVIQFTSGLSAGTEYQIQIGTENVLPDIGSITSSFEMYTVTGTGVMIEQNWNFGQVFLQPKQNKVLSVLSRNSMEFNLPGTSFTNLLFDIEIDEDCPTPQSRLKFVIEGGFKFTDSSLVTTLSLLGAAPVIVQSVIESPNVIITTFDESFTDGRKFSLRIADISNPLSISSGYISVYYIPFNSMSPMQVSELSIPIKTIPYVPSIALLTIDGTVPSTPATTDNPIKYYTNTIQYIKMTIVVTRDISPDFVIQIQSDTLVIHEGSVFAKTSTVEAQTLTYEHYASNGVRISGFPLIPDSSTITVTMRVYIGATSIFTVTTKIDEYDNLADPIIEGTVSSIAAAQPETYLSNFRGSQNEPQKLDDMQTSDSSIFFTVTPNFLTNAGSSLEIITSNKMVKTSSFSTLTSCTVAGNPQPCTIVTDTSFTTITIASNSSHNLFPQSDATNVVIDNLDFLFSSSHSEHIFHFYFSLTISEAHEAPKKYFLKVPNVIPQREKLTSFGNYFSNDMNNTGTNFPNIFRLVSDDTAQWQNVVQAYERRVISVFAYQGWRNLFTSLENGDQYPARSNIAGFTYRFRQGTSTNRYVQYPIDWDSIDIVLDGSQTTTDFSIILPTTFLSNAALLFQIMVGVMDLNTRVVRYLQIEPRPQSGNPTYKMAAGASLSSKPKMLLNKIDLAGKAGSYKNEIVIDVTPGNLPYSGSTYEAALILVTDWQFFDDSSVLHSNSTAVGANPKFSDVEQSPLWIYLPNNQKYLTYIPLFTSSNINTAFQVIFDSIKLPYSHDLPYYSIYLVDNTGTIDSFNELINQDKGVFYESYFKSLTFTCNVISLGVQNTYCTLTFKPNHDVQIGSKLAVYFTGMQISTNLCTMVNSNSGASIDVSCESNTNKNQLQLTLHNNERLEDNIVYSVKIFGVSILPNTIIHYIVAQLKDPTSSYIIETGTRILLTSVADFRPIYITEVSYTKNNPIVYSTFKINFNLPRQLNEDESFAVVMSKDLSNLNTVFSKLNVQLFDAGGVQIPAVWTLNLKYYQILFQGLHNVLTAANYSIQIHGIKTPSTIEQDLLSVIYFRNYDLSYTVYNNEQSTQQFPLIGQKVNSLIIMQPAFNTEGMQQQLTFTIVNQYSVVNVETVWIINLPRYYSEHIWNEDYLIYCKIESSPIKCHKDQNTPYQIIIEQSPRIIEIGDTYVIKVFGIPCPRAAYLNGNADYVTQSIFLGIAQTSQSQSFIEYSELFLVETIINPEDQLGYGSIIVTGIQSSNMEVLQTTFFTIQCISTVDIPTNHWIYITFPQEFDNFNDLELTVEVVQGADDQTYTSEVVNRRIGFQLTSGMSIDADTPFQLQISSLPTPTNPGEIDMNKLVIMAATQNRLGTIAASIQKHNLVDSMEFIPSQLHVVINNYQTITVTAGTYSLPIKIQPSDFTTFQSNMKITFVSDALDFQTSPTYIYLGEDYSTFSVGADQSLIPTIYAFDIIKTQSSIRAYYSSLSKYTVLISNTPVQIAIPSSMDVPEGGCSVPYEIQLANSPYSDISLNFEYDTTLYNLHFFWVNEQISYNQLQFDTKITKRWLSFCAETNIGLSSVDVKLFLGGTNYQSYELSTHTISVNIIANSTTNVAPTFTLQDKNLQKTYAGFDVTTNIPGQIFYQLELAPMGTPLEFIDLKTYVKQYQHTLESQSDFLTEIYLTDRDHRVGMMDVAAGVNALEFDDMLPGQSYTLCVYFENQHRQLADRQCQTFAMMDWGIITKASISFTNAPIYDNQLNKILCFFVKASQSEIDQVIDLEGKSCSLSSTPENYNYDYSGQTLSSQKTQTIVYFITNRNLTTDPSVTLFSDIYDSDGITAASLFLALDSFAINYIDVSEHEGTFDPVSAIAPSSSFRPSFSSGDAQYSSGYKTISIPGVSLSRPGSVYFVLTFNKRITYNNITGSAQIQIRTAEKPSAKNILNCLDAYSKEPLECKRVFLKPGQSRSITFENIPSDSVYVVYYVVAGQYPLRPVVASGVGNFTVITTFEILAMPILGILLALLVFVSV